MKAIKLISLCSLIIFGLIACEQSSNVEVTKLEDFDSPLFATIDYSDFINGIDEATYTNDASLNSVLLNYSFMTPDKKFTASSTAFNGIPWLFRYDFTKHLGFILRKLNLDENQRAAVQGFMKDYHDGMRALIKKFHDVNKPIFEQARADRKAIMDDLKAGQITREEAGVKIKELNIKTKEAILNNPENENIKKDACDLRADLFAKIKSVLVGEQLDKWENMIKRIKSPC